MMFTLTSILSSINPTGPRGPHNSNVTPCQSITALISQTGKVSRICWVVEVNLYSHSRSWDLADMASVYDDVYFGGFIKRPNQHNGIPVEAFQSIWCQS